MKIAIAVIIVIDFVWNVKGMTSKSPSMLLWSNCQTIWI